MHDFYFIPLRHTEIVTMPVYKDNIVLLCSALNREITEHAITRDSRKFHRLAMSHFIEMYLFNLTDEDLTYLNLLGVEIKKSSAVQIPELSHAIDNNHLAFTSTTKWRRTF